MTRRNACNISGQIAELKKKGHPLAYVGDVVGTGSSRKSATNSILWYMGNDIPGVPNKKQGAVVDGKCSLVLGTNIAPIFFNTMEDSGALPIELDVNKMNMGDVIDVYPYEGKACNNATGEVLCSGWKLKTEVLFDEVQAGGRIPLIIGRSLTAKAGRRLCPNPTLDASGDKLVATHLISDALEEKTRLSLPAKACTSLGLPPASCFKAFASPGAKPKGCTAELHEPELSRFSARASPRFCGVSRRALALPDRHER